MKTAKWGISILGIFLIAIVITGCAGVQKQKVQQTSQEVTDEVSKWVGYAKDLENTIVQLNRLIQDRDQTINELANKEPVVETVTVEKIIQTEGQKPGTVSPTKGIKVKPILFGTDSVRLGTQALGLLEDAIPKMKSSSRYIIEGHADERGSTEYNLALGLARAQEVADYLTKSGINPNSISIVSKGKTDPACKAKTEQCLQKNRRVIIREIQFK